MSRRCADWRATGPLILFGVSTYVERPLPDWRTLRRLRTEGLCPQPVPGQNLTYTVICTVQPDGSYGHAICGFVGRLGDLSRLHWFWDGYAPWTAVTTTFTTALGTNQSWSVPADWNNVNNRVEAIGAGGNTVSGTAGHTGGGGGAYATATNITLTLGGSTVYTIASATDTMFVDASTLLAKCGANSGTTTSDVAGGASASCVPTTGAFSGGAGRGISSAGGGTGGGGGAAGSSGIGKSGSNDSGGNSGGGGGGSNGGSSTAGSNLNGGTGSTGIAGGTGGNSPGSGAALSGSGGGGSSGSQSGGAGGSGVPIWTQSSDSTVAGAGGGGGGGPANNTFQGGVGGAYGGGAGGRYNPGTANSGGQGIIVATYTPFFGSKPMRSRTFLTR